MASNILRIAQLIYFKWNISDTFSHKYHGRDCKHGVDQRIQDLMSLPSNASCFYFFSSLQMYVLSVCTILLT